jgi:hypothetical protein
MFYDIPLPSKELPAANKLGLNSIDVSAPDPIPLSLAHGVVYFPPIETAWPKWADDSDVVSNIRASIDGNFNAILAAIVRTDERMQKISRDQRFSPEGRYEEMKKAFLELYNSGLFRESLSLVPKLFADLAKEFDKLTKPPKLASSDAATAIADSELRGILRAKTVPERIHTLRLLAFNEPDSPMLVAALRSSPEALEIPRDLFTELRASYGVAVWPGDMLSIWTASCYNASLAGLIYYGLTRLGAFIGEANGSMTDTFAHAFGGKEYRQQVANITALVEAANRSSATVRSAEE